MLSGSIPALPTPFRGDAIDEAALRDHVSWLIEEGSSALVACGTTGEAHALTDDENRRVLDICVAEVAGRVPVIAGCGTASTATTLARIRQAHDSGASAAMVMPPYYVRPDQRGILAHFAHLAHAADKGGLPMVLYNVPSRTGVDMLPETMGELVTAFPEAFVAVKDATGVIARVSLQRDSCGTRFRQLSGCDETTLGFMTSGAQGGHSSFIPLYRRRFRRKALCPGGRSVSCARCTRCPVKVSLPRHLIINNTTHRPATIQRIRIGATPDGRITAIGHDGVCGNLPEGGIENTIQQTRWLYAGPNRLLTMRKAILDLPEGNDMRAPGMMALEVAMDEMAEKLKLDPVEFRIRNDTQIDPENPDRPFSQQQLNECLKIGAEKFGWNRRKSTPRSTCDGRWLIGMGMSAGYRKNLLTNSAARVRRTRSGRVVVETDIGTGSYTILPQTAAEMMGLPLNRIDVRLGDSDFPVSCGSGGQFGANNATAGLYVACMKLREAAALKLGIDPARASFADGQVIAGRRRFPLHNAARDGEIIAEDSIEHGDLARKYQQSTFAAHFCEAAVDFVTGEMRIRRMLSVCAAGRILNPKAARSQFAVCGGRIGVSRPGLDEVYRDAVLICPPLSGPETMIVWTTKGTKDA